MRGRTGTVVRFVRDDYGVGMEVGGLTGPRRVYFARKPKDGLSMCREDYPERSDAANQVFGVGSVGLHALGA